MGHGTKEKKDAYMAAYSKRPEVRAKKLAYMSAYNLRPETKARKKVARQTEAYKEKEKIRQSRWHSNPENKAKSAAYKRTDKFKSWKVNYRQTPEGRAKEMFASARTRARKAGITFNLDFDSIQKSVLDGKCQVTGREFCLTTPPGGKRAHPRAPSIDRIDNNKGYENDNVQIVIWAYNVAKNEWTDEELLGLFGPVAAAA